MKMKKLLLIAIIVGVLSGAQAPIQVEARPYAGISATLARCLNDNTGTAGVSKTFSDALREARIAEEKKMKEEMNDAECCETPEPESQEKELGSYTIYDSPGGSFKSFMSWRCITSRSSMQWKLQNWAAYTAPSGIREIDGRLCVAVGSYYNAPIGAYIDLIMENGATIKCIMADQKADEHTDPTHRWHSSDGSVGEFLVEKDALSQTVRQMGDISYVSPELEGNISQIKVYDKVYTFE